MPVFREKNIKTREIFPGVTLTQAVEYDNGSQAVTMGKISIQPGSQIPPHTHPVDDCMVILQGNGELYTVEGSVPIEAGCHLSAPANTWHSMGNDGKEDLQYVTAHPAVDVTREMKED